MARPARTSLLESVSPCATFKNAHASSKSTILKIETLEFFSIDKEDENNQKRLRDLENGQCLLQDLYGRVGVVQIHPVVSRTESEF